ncbi:hypothetical protein [Gordonibacter massiliensis (ex Traore et al. 2017)]|uniref:hypothetical protein n=1 Tax=Gordonibacter massiliensis (ex Traore et al. 2017) TaxID=1841863 RepID=UPI001C8CEA08|nr:hypothetical protein [Gordonibacter massiliensis (ex Traore et al. 2017)]MBX9033489.1 hypothetical protein [Gordonibacter massiliensis (ex Traore et al. 2017)]
MLVAIAALLLAGVTRGYADDCPAGGPHDYEITVVVPVTDDADGLEYLVCSKCGDSFYRTVPATGHKWSAWYVDTPATCTSEGVEARVCAKHPQNVHYEYRTIPPLSPSGEHRFIEVSRADPACTEDGMVLYACSICGESHSEVLPALGHDWGDWETARESTEAEPGVERRACGRCGATEERETPPLAQVDAPKPDEPADSAPPPPDEGGKTPWYATEFFTAGPTRTDAVIVGYGLVVCVVVGGLSVPLAMQVAWLRRKQAEVRRTQGARYAAEHAVVDVVRPSEEGEAS